MCKTMLRERLKKEGRGASEATRDIGSSITLALVKANPIATRGSLDEQQAPLT